MGIGRQKLRPSRALFAAAVAVAVWAIWIAAGSASATVLCKETPKEGACPAGQAYPAETEVSATAEKPFLVTSGEDVTCETSKATVKSSTAGGPSEAVKGTVKSLSFSGCKLTGGATCTVEAVNLPYAAEASWTSGSNGSLTVKNGGSGEPSATASCTGGAVACVFGAEPTVGLEGGNPALVNAPNTAMKLTEKTGFMKCPKEATLTAIYKATSPTAIYVAKEAGSAAVLCKVAPEGGSCPEGKNYAVGQQVKAEATKLTLKNSTDSINCNRSTIWFQITNAGSATEAAKGAVESLAFFECLTAKTLQACTLTVTVLPTLEFNWLTGSNGTMAFKPNKESGEAKMTMQCGIGIACVANLEFPLSFEGGNPAKFSFPKTPLKLSKAKGFELCPKEANWEEVNYSVSTPEGIYLAK
jgi:hypothetical protein